MYTNGCFCAFTGDDFSATSFNITIPATEDRPPGPIFEDIQQNDPLPKFRVIDDDVNEIDQSFALVAQLGDVPESFACFQRPGDGTDCFGRTGATVIKIMDNDGKYMACLYRRVNKVGKFSLCFIAVNILFSICMCMSCHAIHIHPYFI